MDRAQIFMISYQFAAVATAIVLIADDARSFDGWNWLIIIPVNMFLAAIWPIYWGVLHWVM